MGLPKTRFHHDFILVVVDKLTKVTHFILGNTIDDAPTIVNKFSHEIFKLHNFLEVIILDRDLMFTSIFWKSLHRALGTRLNMSSTYHRAMNYILHDYRHDMVEDYANDLIINTKM